MKYHFEATVKLHLQPNPKTGKSKHIQTDFMLSPSKNLQTNMYVSRSGLPNKEGSRVLTQVLVQGLIGNIHSCHEKGWIDSAEHLRLIISELERGFIQQVNISEGEM